MLCGKHSPKCAPYTKFVSYAGINANFYVALCSMLLPCYGGQIHTGILLAHDQTFLVQFIKCLICKQFHIQSSLF